MPTKRTSAESGAIIAEGLHVPQLDDKIVRIRYEKAKTDDGPALRFAIELADHSRTVPGAEPAYGRGFVFEMYEREVLDGHIAAFELGTQKELGGTEFGSGIRVGRLDLSRIYDSERSGPSEGNAYLDIISSESLPLEKLDDGLFAFMSGYLRRLVVGAGTEYLTIPAKLRLLMGMDAAARKALRREHAEVAQVAKDALKGELEMIRESAAADTTSQERLGAVARGLDAADMNTERFESENFKDI